jgi:hypothetical protein
VAELRNYTRWTGDVTTYLRADILGAKHEIEVDATTGRVLLDGDALSPDEARMFGVRLVEAAALADGARAIRQPAVV